MGARSLDGSDAGAPEGDTHAMAFRKDVDDHPAAGDEPLWHSAHAAARIGATSMSNTGRGGATWRSEEHAPVHARTDAAAQLVRHARDTYVGRTGRLTGALPVSEKIES